MKKIITAVCAEFDGAQDMELSEIEFISSGEKYLFEALKSAKGKYTVVSDGKIKVQKTEDFLKKLEKESADILVFQGGCAVKTSILKGVSQRNCIDKFSVEFFAALNSKTLKKLEEKPFSIKNPHLEYSDDAQENFLEILSEFGKYKAKLAKDVYSYIFEMLLSRLVVFYVLTIIAINKNKTDAETFKNFDLKLKENIILFLALEKRFPCLDLKKLREKEFKLNLLQRQRLLNFAKKM